MSSMTPKKDEEIQVPGSSPVEDTKVASSSPLKTDSSTAALLRDKFVYKPLERRELGANLKNGSGDNASDNSGGHSDADVAKLINEYPDFSETLVKAVFKSNSYDLNLTRERLRRIHSQKSSRSWAWRPGEKKPTSRLMSLGSYSDSVNTSSNGGHVPRHSSTIVASPEKSSKVTLEKQKTSIFDRYSHVMNQRHKPTMESVVVDPSTISQLEPSTRKRRKLLRADDPNRDPSMAAISNTKKSSVSLSDEDEDEISGDENVSGEDYQEYTPDVNIDDEILKFINDADEKDIADVADTTLDKASMVVKSRPFKSLVEFSQMDFLTEQEIQKQQEKKKSSRRGQQKKDGDKLLDKMIQTMKGYNAIDSLIKRCSSYGSLIASQIQKWGVNVEDIQSGELNFIDIGDDESESDEGAEIGITQESGSTGITKKSGKTKKSGDESDFDDEEDDYQDSEDEDYGSRRTRHSGRGRGRPKHKNVKFFKQKPKLLSPDVTLKDYQQTGINWLNLLYQNNMSCILADEMGLGKTCQVIAFLSYLKQNNEHGPHLVVVPSSTLENWLREFNKFCPDMKIEPYYGSQQERAELRDILEDNDGQYDVIVTTYNLASGNKHDVSFLKNRGFNAVIYDEGHMLKNSMSERFNKLMKIEANFRLLLTGTPLQNNLKELMSLLEFIMPNLFVSKKSDLSAVFRQRARTSDSNKDYNPLLAQEAIARAKTMMKPFILRRRKDQVLKHLPHKHSKIEYCEMTDVQRSIYNKEIQQVLEHKKMVKEREERGETAPLPSKNGGAQASKNLIMSLRKASLHPLLFRHIYDDKVLDKMSRAILKEPEYAENGNKEYIQEDMSYLNDFELHRLCLKFPKSLGKFQLKNDEWMESGKIGALGKLLKDIIEHKKEKVLVFSLFTQMLDILEMALTTLNINFLRLDGSTQVNDRQALIDKFYEDESIPVFILSTKAGGFGINLVCANHVIIFDQSFNPHDDKQAADRSHRVGQTKTVHITTLVTRNSIEEKILQLAKNKLALDTYISEDDNKATEALENKVSDMLEDIIYDESK
ncbi:DNA-dependent ATPase FUN30 [Lachancea thermotolerans CBS 6340]|uniref:DNA helicase n=1 Tax=Lachancea thermotolerans (strain ATCC 56472 / CBS 6340 / NRRL Y-8284) TaxID=559295 RepID=C5DG47_LACTC|nr:KLTH0D02354p [Lachancea thermotolerans CBS 6340]CAR22389.1 KLTH0D02354p [Lachancea thermotolerans CBS 6340]